MQKKQYVISILLVLIVSSLCFPFKEIIGYKVVALVLMMAVSVIAMLFEILPVLLAAALSAIIWNYFFIPPVFDFHIGSTEDFLMFLLYFVIALVNVVLTFKIREAEKRARAKEEKEKEIKLYNTLLNSLSHELRTPIATIIGSVDTLKDNKDRLSPKHQLDLFNAISTASIRLNRQVENILNMSRLESGILQPKRDWCDMNELVNTVIQKNAANNSARFIFYLEEHLPLFKLDIGFTEQVLLNLIFNAIQYNSDETKIKIEIHHKDNNCIIVVADDGKGFPENEIPLVFDKFYRLPNSKVGGSGLGLSIVKGFVEAQNGIVTLENNEQGGATFTIAIPAETSYINHLKNE